jgi:hypothetical protein
MCDVHTVHPNPTHHTPNTEHQIPTQNPKPKTQNPKPKTQSPKPKTQNPKPKTQNRKPQTTNHKPQTPNLQLPPTERRRPRPAMGKLRDLCIYHRYERLLWHCDLGSEHVVAAEGVRHARPVVYFCSIMRLLPVFTALYFCNILRMFDLNLSRTLEKSFNSSTFNLYSSESNQ